MKIRSLCITLCIFSACSQKPKGATTAVSIKSPIIENEIIGVWASDPDDEFTQKTIGQVTMTFTTDGQLIYGIDSADINQKINMVYSIKGDTLISDQPSHPQEQKILFTIEDGDRLTLQFEGENTRFVRVAE